MNNHKLNSDERLAAMQERIDRLANRSALAQQMQVCARDRDTFADMLNCAIDERDELRAKVTELEARVVELCTDRDRLRGVLEEIQHVVIDLEPGSIAFYTRILEITKAFEDER